MFKKAVWSLALIAVAATITGCAGPGYTDVSPTAKLRVKILLDGSDSLHLKGGKLWINHHAYQLPGRYNGVNEPVVVNGVEWYPKWIGNQSEIFTELNVHLPKKDLEAAVESKGGWGLVGVWEQPTAENDYTLTVSIDDRGPAGANWYTIDIDW